ncbi:hypothetical protein [Undibacterium griseum]|uniref:Uncharacterized protein n=1 Tax=Undibacterium griseum TaxID=2762295 RepID=A0ABR6YP46_9BURK|nr:hypothetical protein [Undibacterium griseum]MBC3885679.1 hypothetical protein [Undibacterium griseum]
MPEPITAIFMIVDSSGLSVNAGNSFHSAAALWVHHAMPVNMQNCRDVSGIYAGGQHLDSLVIASCTLLPSLKNDRKIYFVTHQS